MHKVRFELISEISYAQTSIGRKAESWNKTLTFGAFGV